MVYLYKNFNSIVIENCHQDPKIKKTLKANNEVCPHIPWHILKSKKKKEP